jgi:hypothetical protein
MKTIVLSLFLAFAAVYSQAQPNPQLWNWPTCQSDPNNALTSAETFALGNIFADSKTIDEGNDYLEFSTAVFPALCVLDQSYTTQFQHNVQAIGFQMGSSIDVAEEWAFWVDITFPAPSNRTIRLPKQQYDKHWANGPGNRNEIMNINLILPVGTTIRIRRPAVVCAGIPTPSSVNPRYPQDYGPYNQNNCMTGQAITLVGQ